MGIFNKYFKKEDSVKQPINFQAICRKAALLIENYDNPDYENEYYQFEGEENSLNKLESKIIAFVMISYRLKEINNSNTSLTNFWVNNNVLKKLFHELVQNTDNTVEIKHGLEMSCGKKLNNNEDFRNELMLYFSRRISNYSNFISLDSDIDIQEKILDEINVWQFYQNPFLTIYDIKLYYVDDYILIGKEKINDLHPFEFSMGLKDAFDLVKIQIN